MPPAAAAAFERGVRVGVREPIACPAQKGSGRVAR